MKYIDTNKSLRRFQMAGYASMFLMVGVGGAWSAFTDINGAVIAPATVAVESFSKKIQHKEGGIVKQILVKDGDSVTEGQVLVVMDDTDTKSELGIIDALLVENLARRARLEAQRDNAAKITFPDEILSRANEDSVAKIMAGQIKLFDARNEALSGKKDQFSEQLGQLGEQIIGLEAQRKSKETQLKFINQELASLQGLQKKGLVPASRVLGMQREQARLEGESGELIASKASAEGKIGEVKIQILQVDEQARADTLNEMRDVESKVAEFQERKIASSSKLSRTEIKAPAAGDVYQVSVHTVGGVIAPGETVMLLVPKGDDLVLQAQVSPKDIDQIEVGQAAHVRFPAFHSRFTPEIGADVIQVAADTSRVDANTPPFYSVRLRIPAKELKKLDGKQLKPGMPAEAFIETNARTPLSYLLKPFTDQVAHAFREI
jgi:HlyD family secretion protein